MLLRQVSLYWIIKKFTNPSLLLNFFLSKIFFLTSVLHSNFSFIIISFHFKTHELFFIMLSWNQFRVHHVIKDLWRLWFGCRTGRLLWTGSVIYLFNACVQMHYIGYNDIWLHKLVKLPVTEALSSRWVSARPNSSVLAMELRLSCTNPLKCPPLYLWP